MAQITSIEQLGELYSQPSTRAANKSLYELDGYTRTFIEHCPFLLLSSVDEQGMTDVSPRGGLPGFVAILDNKTLLIPDSPGNNRLDTFRNLLERPGIGLMLMVPGVEEVVRIKGIASLHDDEEWLARCLDGKRPPKLVIKVDIQETFFHCAKAIMRAKLWDGTYTVDRDILPSLAKILKEQQNLDGEAMEQKEMVDYYQSTL